MPPTVPQKEKQKGGKTQGGITASCTASPREASRRRKEKTLKQKRRGAGSGRRGKISGRNGPDPPSDNKTPGVHQKCSPRRLHKEKRE